MADPSITEGNPFQQVRPLTPERAQLFARTAEQVAERYEEELARWLGETTVRAEPVESIVITDLGGPELDLTAVKADQQLTPGVLATDLHLALTIVSMLCGGLPRPAAEVRPLSRLEIGVFDLVALPLVTIAAEAYSIGRVELGAHLTSATGLPDAKEEPAVAVPMRIRNGELEGRMTVAFTMAQLQLYSEEVDRRIAGRITAKAHRVNRQAVRAVRPVPVELVVGFDPLQVPAGQLAGLQVGDVLRTRQSVSRHLVARVGSERLFHARAAQRGQRLVAELIARIETDRGPA